MCLEHGNLTDGPATVDIHNCVTQGIFTYCLEQRKLRNCLAQGIFTEFGKLGNYRLFGTGDTYVLFGT